MALIVGDLTQDLSAQSFISLADADAYLAPENPTAWMALDGAEKEAALIRASRWLAMKFRFLPLTDDGLTRVGRVAARLASESLNASLFAGTDTTQIVESVKVGPIAESYNIDAVLNADAGGISWGWLRGALRGLTRSATTVPVVRV